MTQVDLKTGYGYDINLRQVLIAGNEQAIKQKEAEIAQLKAENDTLNDELLRFYDLRDAL